VARLRNTCDSFLGSIDLPRDNCAFRSRERRREREAYYRHETLRKIADSPGTSSGAMLEILREEERIAARQRRESQKISGLVTIAAGVGLAVFLGIVDRNDRDPAYLVGLIPMLVGAAFLFYAYVLAPAE
jgi:hypothetical protein